MSLTLFNLASRRRDAALDGAVRRVLAGIATGATGLAAATHALASDVLTDLDPLQADSVPEPDTLALVGAAVAVIALIMLFRRKRRGK